MVLFEASNYCNGLSEHLYNARRALSNSIYTPTGSELPIDKRYPSGSGCIGKSFVKTFLSYLYKLKLVTLFYYLGTTSFRSNQSKIITFTLHYILPG